MTAAFRRGARLSVSAGATTALPMSKPGQPPPAVHQHPDVARGVHQHGLALAHVQQGQGDAVVGGVHRADHGRPGKERHAAAEQHGEACGGLSGVGRGRAQEQEGGGGQDGPIAQVGKGVGPQRDQDAQAVVGIEPGQAIRAALEQPCRRVQQRVGHDRRQGRCGCGQPQKSQGQHGQTQQRQPEHVQPLGQGEKAEDAGGERQQGDGGDKAYGQQAQRPAHRDKGGCQPAGTCGGGPEQWHAVGPVVQQRQQHDDARHGQGRELQAHAVHGSGDRAV